MNDAPAKSIGLEVIKLFDLKVNKSTGRVDTTWGSKTPEGIGRVIERIIKENENVTA